MNAIPKTTGYIAPKMKVPFIIKRNDLEIEMIDFQAFQQHYLLKLSALKLTDDNYRIFVNGHNLSLIFSEIKEIKRPIYTRNMTWNLNKQQNYEVMKSVDVWLPGNNFYLIKHYLVPEYQMLHVILGKTNIN
jgi:hypothetical protein